MEKENIFILIKFYFYSNENILTADEGYYPLIQYIINKLETNIGFRASL